MQQQFNYYEVTAKAISYLEDDLGYGPQRLAHFRRKWKCIKNYMESIGSDVFDVDLCTQYILSIYNGRQFSELPLSEKVSIRAVKFLIQFMENGMLKRQRKLYYLEGATGMAMKGFLAYKESYRVSPRTIENLTAHFSKFNLWLSVNNISEITHVEQSHIHRFIGSLDPQQKASIHGILVTLKSFFKHLFDQKKIAQNLAVKIPKDNYHYQSEIPSYYSESEIDQLMRSVDRLTCLGKRNYAMLVIAGHLGLRASDIANLKFENLHWENSTVTIRQYKTGKDISLPLVPIVGNAILDYIQYARPKSNDQHVFLKRISPYPPLTGAAVSGAIGRCFRCSGLEFRDRRRGAHALRHSLVKELLSNRQPLSTISTTLGHTSMQSTQHYIRIDAESLRQCSLDVPMVDPLFYSQKEGLLYV